MGERDVDGLSLAVSKVELVVDLDGAYIRADAAANALALYDEPRFAPDLDVEVADESLNVLHLGVRHQRYVRVSCDIHHLGRQYAYRTVARREGLVELCHPATDARLRLDEVDLEPHLGHVEGRLYACHSSAYDQRGLLHGHLTGLEGHEPRGLGDAHPDKVDRLPRGLFLLLGVDPGTLLTQVDHL